jgi:hypothetical protein
MLLGRHSRRCSLWSFKFLNRADKPWAKVVLPQEFVRHYLKEVADDGYVMAVFIQSLVDVNWFRLCSKKNLKKEHRPPVNPLLGLEFSTGEPFCLGGKTLLVEAGIFNHPKAGVFEYEVDIIIEDV